MHTKINTLLGSLYLLLLQLIIIDDHSVLDHPFTDGTGLLVELLVAVAAQDQVHAVQHHHVAAVRVADYASFVLGDILDNELLAPADPQSA